jgi:hypothetical protein
MIRAKHTADLNDEDWNAVGGLIPLAYEGGRPRSVDMYELDVRGAFFRMTCLHGRRYMDIFAVSVKTEHGAKSITVYARVCLNKLGRT